VALFWGDVHRHASIAIRHEALLVKNPDSTSLRFAFACLANKRLKVALTPGFNIHKIEMGVFSVE
jgi:hypothetical protein